jgi:[ribosomal protein S5]-alanine N-acetyltransferase
MGKNRNHPDSALVKTIPMAFKTARLILRLFEISDYQNWKKNVANTSSEEGSAANRMEERISYAKFRSMISRFDKLREQDHTYVFAVFEKATEALIGKVELMIYARSSFQWGNLGYRIYKQHRSKGFGSEAARAAITIGLKHLHLHRIESAIDPKNLASISVAKKAGMQRECIRKKFVLIEEKWADLLIFVATKESITSSIVVQRRNL